MKKIYILSMALASILSACSGEDDIKPGAPEDNYFINTYGSSAADRQLQEDFFNRNGIYMLFNDTLRKEQIGVDTLGLPFYDLRLVDIGYGMNNNMNPNTESISYDYLASENDKREGVAFINDYVLPSLGKPLRPFSFLLVDKIHHNTLYYGNWRAQDISVFSGWRCTALAVSGVGSMDAAQKKALKNTILQTIVSNAILTVDASLFDKFYSFCEPYYSTYAMYEPAEEFIKQYPTMHDVGFLSAYSYGNPNGFYIYNFKAKSYDLEDYTNALFAMTEDEFMAMYGQYPIVVEKYRILKKIVEDLGVVF